VIYLQASIKLRPGKLPEFVSLINDLLPIVGKHGWKLIGSYATVAGRLNTVVDWWELPNEAAVSAITTDREFRQQRPRIADIIEDEAVTILTKLPIG
jgi:hypothetical protein